MHLYTADDTASIALHLYEVNENNTFVLKKDSGFYTNVRMGCFIEDDIKPNKNGYILLASTSDNGKYIEFFAELSSLKINHLKITELNHLNSESDSF